MYASLRLNHWNKQPFLSYSNLIVPFLFVEIPTREIPYASYSKSKPIFKYCDESGEYTIVAVIQYYTWY